MRVRWAALGLFLSGVVAAQGLPAGAIQFPPDRLPWTAGPPSLPAGTQVAVLEGDPKKEGMFTMRLRVPAGARIAPHWHPREERVTVLAGAAHVAFGGQFDDTAGTRFPAGSFYVNPPDARHYVWFTEDSIVQITGQGPWQLHYVEPTKK